MDGAANLAQQLIEVIWNGGDREAAREIVSEGVDVHPSRSVGPGPDGQAAVGDYFRSGFPDARWVVEDAFGEGDKAVVRWRMTGRHDGPFEGVPPTGTVVEFAGITVVRIDSGRIAEIWHAEDLFGLFAQIGARPVAGIPDDGGISGG